MKSYGSICIQWIFQRRPSGQDTVEYVQSVILTTYRDGPEKSYLLQCATWEEDEYDRNLMIAYGSSSTWPLYSVELNYTNSDESEIEYMSWKGDYESYVRRGNPPRGNLPYAQESPIKHYKGDIWTRGR